MHRVVEPKILYFGTPIVLISTMNENDTPNLAPMSSAWWLGNSCMLGLSARSQTIENLERTGECVLNLPSPHLVDAIDRLAMTTGKNPVPRYKEAMGYRYEPSKFEIAGLTPIPSDLVAPPRVEECWVQLEAQVEQIRPLGGEGSHLASIEVSILRVHADESILIPGKENYINPHVWQPIIMNFCEFFGLSSQLHPSRLAEIWLSKVYEPAQPIETTVKMGD